MCGLAGFLEIGGHHDASELACIVAAMADHLVHRGPDGEGVWVDPATGIALGHRRLAIRDLSDQGCQPMQSACGRFVLVCNGEIYNSNALREELERAASPRWRSVSDTETLLEAIRQWGLESTLGRLTGMFALALWDSERRVLSLARDRLGEKPLYYGWLDGILLFGSELKALRAHPAWRGEIDHDQVVQFLSLGYVPAPATIYQAIHKLPPGTWLEISGSPAPPPLTPRPYWTLAGAVREGVTAPFQDGAESAIVHLENLLRQSVRAQMEADVPVGIMLSGGVDSSLIAALMRAEGGGRIKTFSVGFQDAGFNEAPHALQVARHLGSDHAEMVISSAQVKTLVPDLPEIFDEPFADPAQIPACLLAGFARQEVKACLSGDGGDELFGGYDRYLWGVRAWEAGQYFPSRARKMLASLLDATPGQLWNSMARALPARTRNSVSEIRLRKLASVLAAESPEDAYQCLVGADLAAAGLVVGLKARPSFFDQPDLNVATLGMAPYMMYRDGIGYLPDDVMTKVDRACMSVGLESRAPFMDHHVAEFAWRLPASMKIHKGQNKWLLRQILHRHVPEKLVDRPKTGFAVPLENWLRDPLRAWAENLLEQGYLAEKAGLNPPELKRMWRDHQEGKRNGLPLLWRVLMLLAWLERWT